MSKLKIAITFADATHAFHIGGEVERTTVIVEVDAPKQYEDYLRRRNEKGTYLSMSTSIVEVLSE